MTLPTSGSISAQDINLELGRVATALFSLAGVEERELAGVPSGTIGFADFYGKSNAQEYSTTLTLGYTFSGYGYYSFNKTTATGTAIPERVNGLTIYAFGEGQLGYLANLDFAGRWAADELVRIVIDTDGQGDTTDYAVPAGANRSTSLTGIPIPDYQKTNAENPFSVSLFFRKEYLHGFSFTSEKDSQSDDIGFVWQFYGTIKKASPRDFVINGVTRSLYSVKTHDNNTKLGLGITNNLIPFPSSGVFSSIRLVSPAVWNFGTSQLDPLHVVELDESSATLLNGSGISTWTWDLVDGILVDRNYDLVIIK
jgi:hypothetical protein